MKEQPEKIKDTVRERYGEIARQQRTSCCGSPNEQASCCVSTDSIYCREQLEGIPDNIAGSSLGCGDPTAITDLKPGEVVLDLGSGGGLDCFLAAKRVGKEGKVIGLDMTPDMVRLARENAQQLGVANVEFRLGEMEHMPIDTDSIDVIISNCVINLSTDKDAVFWEAFRVLRSGGRLSIADKALLEDLPEQLQDNPDAWAGCIAGAISKDIYLDKIRAAGFTDVAAEEDRAPLYVKLASDDCCSSCYPSDYLDLTGKVINLKVRARKPW